MYFDSDDAYAFVLGLTGWMLRGFDDHARGQAKDQLRATIAAHAGSSGVTYDSASGSSPRASAERTQVSVRL